MVHSRFLFPSLPRGMSNMKLGRGTIQRSRPGTRLNIYLSPLSDIHGFTPLRHSREGPWVLGGWMRIQWVRGCCLSFMLANHCREITHSLDCELILYLPRTFELFALGEAISTSLQAFINAVPAMNRRHNNSREIFIFSDGVTFTCTLRYIESCHAMPSWSSSVRACNYCTYYVK